MKPNIFDIAPKELNQDAFITWILMWADEANAAVDPELHRCGKDFVKNLLSKWNLDTDLDVKSVKAGRQWNNIDVWAEVNEKYLIIIEDKTFTGQHSNQLETYKKVAQNWCDKKGFELVCIYLKTGSESMSSLSKVKKPGFKVFDRVDFLAILNNYPQIENAIFRDFTDRLNRLEAAHARFETCEIEKWNDHCWVGFYQFVEKNRKIVNWHKVNNQAGGFWNAVLNWYYWGDYPVYLQIEQGKLCFKISTDPDEIDIKLNPDQRSQLRNKWYAAILKEAKKQGLEGIEKPSRFGNGKYMTVAVVNQQNWLGQGNECLDKEEALAKLKKYEIFLKDVLAA